MYCSSHQLLIDQESHLSCLFPTFLIGLTMQPTVIANGHGHGRWRGRGQERGRGRGRAFQSSQDQNQGRPFEEGLGPVPLGRFDNRALRFVGAVGSLPGQTTQAQSSEHSTNDPADVVITQVRALGSYNWTGEQEPNIIVPGELSGSPRRKCC
jgi:hypothetical protein